MSITDLYAALALIGFVAFLLLAWGFQLVWRRNRRLHYLLLAFAFILFGVQMAFVVLTLLSGGTLLPKSLSNQLLYWTLFLYSHILSMVGALLAAIPLIRYELLRAREAKRDRAIQESQDAERLPFETI